MSFYVKRKRISDGRIGYTGPIRSERQAEREANAWRTAESSTGDGWLATIYPADKDMRRRVREWQCAVRCGEHPTS